MSPSSSVNSICGESRAAEIVDENQRLRKENEKLREELERVKVLCGDIYNLMIQKYAGGGGGSEEEEEESSMKLFGVAIGVKRGRGGDEGRVDCGEEEPWMTMRRRHYHRRHAIN
ncbi:hypothetical protein MLD38_015664 [Melastoma candidum]|nr:hypothetical protein MLD38_015664 [Melastoma candidum]